MTGTLMMITRIILLLLLIFLQNPTTPTLAHSENTLRPILVVDIIDTDDAGLAIILAFAAVTESTCNTAFFTGFFALGAAEAFYVGGGSGWVACGVIQCSAVVTAH
jgi:hypothetical protein